MSVGEYGNKIVKIVVSAADGPPRSAPRRSWACCVCCSWQDTFILKTSEKIIAFTLTTGMAALGAHEVVGIDQPKQIHPEMEPPPQFIQSSFVHPSSGSIPASGEPLALRTNSGTSLWFVFPQRT